MSRSPSRVPTSSPLSSIDSSQATFKTGSSQPHPQYRPAAPLPLELEQHVRIFLEENLFSQAFDLLLSSISAGGTHDSKKVPVVAPKYLGFVATLTVHPSFTTRASTKDKVRQSNAALRLLRTLSRTTGPVNAKLDEAYRFRRYAQTSRVGSEGEEDDWKQGITIKYADEESLFTEAGDFWSVVGLALNCSCLPGLYADRWEYWCPWLEHMLDVLESDWKVREELGTCEQSILAQYITNAEGGNAKARRILRAVFADGSEQALATFKEVFRKETKPVKTHRNKENKQEVTVDVDEEIYGDWMQESESTTDEEELPDDFRDDTRSRPAKRLRRRTPSTKCRTTSRGARTMGNDYEDTDNDVHVKPITHGGLGPPEAISIRLRLLQLLTTFSVAASTNKSQGSALSDLHELFTLFVEFVKSLPPRVFQQVILPTGLSSDLKPDTRIALCEFILRRLIDNDKMSKQGTLDPMTQERLMREYLPFMATGSFIEFHAKVSVLLESVLRTMAQQNDGTLMSAPELLDAIDRGINLRLEWAQDIRDHGRYKGTTSDHEEHAWRILKDSSTRMRYFVENFIN